MEPADLWQRIRQGYQIPDMDNAIVREKTAYYAARPEYLQRVPAGNVPEADGAVVRGEDDAGGDGDEL